MSVIFTLPRQVPLAGGALLPGGKLTFTITGTTTAQNTYQDQALTTPHANPVVADSNGVFPAIYLSPILPNYRVKLTTAANVTVYQEDDYPANQNVQQSLRLESTNPFVFFYDTDGVSGSRKYRVRAAGDSFEVQAVNDAETIFTTVIKSTGSVLTNGTWPFADNQTGSFSASFTGMTGATNGTLNYHIIGDVVTLWADANISGTSNATGMTISNLPATLQPTSLKIAPCSGLQDNGNSPMSGDVSITGGVLTFRIAKTNPVANFVQNLDTGFTNSGAKGIRQGWSIKYPIQ